MEVLKNVMVAFLVLGGIFFFAVGTLGLLRLPDALTRMHAAAKADTLGAGMVLLGVALQAGPTALSLKLLVIVAFVWFTAPTATHVMARVAYRDTVFTPIVAHRVDLEDIKKGD